MAAPPSSTASTSATLTLIFSPSGFPVEDKDIIYVANARLNELQKFFTLLNTITGPVITGIVVKGSVSP